MTSLTLDEIPDESTVFLDANIFVYYSTGTSVSCRMLLDRCATGAVHGLTSLTVLLEVAHRLMIIEAQQKGLIRGRNPAQKLAESPEIVKKLELKHRSVTQQTRPAASAAAHTVRSHRADSRSLLQEYRSGQ